GARNMPREPIDLPELDAGVPLYARSLTVAEWEKWEVERGEKLNKKVDRQHRASMVVMGLVDGSGASVFQPDDAAILGEFHPAAIDRVYEKIKELTEKGPTRPGEPEKKASPTANASSTDSPSR